MKLRTILSLVTAVLLILLVIIAWPDIRQAFDYLGSVNLWILSLLIPIQLISYYAGGETLFSYLRAKGDLKNMNGLKMTRVALEFNFVNHVFPSGGASGVAYLGWLLSKFGVSTARSTMAQAVRYGLTFLSFVLFLIVALAILVIDDNIDRLTLLLSLALVFLALFGTGLFIYVLRDSNRVKKFSRFLVKAVNAIVKKITFGRKTSVLKFDTSQRFFEEMHQDYKAIAKDKKILIKPFLWTTLANLMDVAMTFVAFWSFGFPINPAIIYIAYGLATSTSALAVTPGGTGVYEAVMVGFLASAGVPADIAIAGTLLARVMLILGTIIFGYVFYQSSILKHGKHPIKR